MEFHEKLLELRKQKGLTQEELASFLYVSRTAVSKWESARGYPNIDSLKAISKFFGVTIDELLSKDKLLTVAEKDRREKKILFRALIFGLLDCSAAGFFFLPLFRQTADGVIQAASLLSLTEPAPYVRAAYYALILGLTAFGILTLGLQNCRQAFWLRSRFAVSLCFNALGLLLFTVSLQPYAAAYLFLLLTVKALICLKRP